MKRILIAFLLVLNIGIAYSADKTITSKTYVDNQIATKQDKIPAVDTNTVITHTGESGNIGEKGIYDSTGNYAEQQTSLVTAGDANTGINNALENEFVCIDEDTDHTCLLWKIRNITEHSASKNLFNISKMTDYTYGGTSSLHVLVNNGNGSISVTTPSNDSAISTGKKLSQLVPGLEVGKTYTLSFKSDYSTKVLLYYFSDSSQNILWTPGTSQVMTQTMLNSVFYFSYRVSATQNIYDIQMEEGSVATEYEPYKNLYIPQNQ